MLNFTSVELYSVNIVGMHQNFAGLSFFKFKKHLKGGKMKIKNIFFLLES